MSERPPTPNTRWDPTNEHIPDPIHRPNQLQCLFRQWQNLFALFAYKFKIRKHSLCRWKFIYTISWMHVSESGRFFFALDMFFKGLDAITITSNGSVVGARSTTNSNQWEKPTTQTNEKNSENVHLINFSEWNSPLLLHGTHFEGNFLSFSVWLGGFFVCVCWFSVWHQFGICHLI